MDAKKLVVGQDVYVVSNDGRSFCQGKVRLRRKAWKC